MYCCDKPIIPPNMSGMTWLKVGWDIPVSQFPVECASCQKPECCEHLKRDWHGVVSQTLGPIPHIDPRGQLVGVGNGSSATHLCWLVDLAGL